MKKTLLLLSLTIPLWGFAQSTTILPNAVGVPKVTALAACNSTEKGKQVFNSTNNKMYYCNGANWQEMTGGGFTLPYRDSLSSSNTLLYLENSGGGAIFGKGSYAAGIYGMSKGGTGVVGISDTYYGGYFESSANYPALYAYNYGSTAARFIGDVGITGDVTLSKNINIHDELTVDNGKGIVRSNSATQQKIVKVTDGPYAATNLAVGGFVEESLEYENFGGIPTVFVGQASSTTGEWYKVQVLITNVTTNSCTVRFVNTASDTVTMTGTWSFLIVGPE